MSLFLVGILIINSGIFLITYTIMHKKEKMFSERCGIIHSVCLSGIFSLNIGMIMQFLFSSYLSFTLFIITVIGVTIGILFGSLVKFQSLLAVFFHYIVGSIMGTMLGAVIQNPSLCSLPVSYLNSVNENMIAFSIFGTLLVIVTVCLVYYSLIV